MHVRAIGIENTDDFDAHVVLAVVVKEQRLGTAFTFVLAGTDTYRIDVAPITLRLRMNMRIAIDLAG